MSTDAIMALTRDDYVTAVLVDSIVLLDVITEDAHLAIMVTKEALERAADRLACCQPLAVPSRI